MNARLKSMMIYDATRTSLSGSSEAKNNWAEAGSDVHKLAKCVRSICDDASF
jgi:hypothetical protein